MSVSLARVAALADSTPPYFYEVDAKPKVASPLVNPRIPGNRLYVSQTGSIELDQKTLPFIIGERVVKPLLERGITAAKALSDRTWSVITTLENVWSRRPSFNLPEAYGQPLKETPCYEEIVARYPEIDPGSKEVVRTLCENQLRQLELYNIQLTDVGFLGIRDALAQNTALTEFSLREDPDWGFDTVAFANPFTEALKINRNLKKVTLSLSDIGSGPTLMNALGAQRIFQNLPCFNLDALDLGPIDFQISTAQALRDTLIQNPHFPLRRFAFFASEGTTQMALTAQGLSANRCITELYIIIDLDPSLMPDIVTSIFQAVGAGETIATAYIDILPITLNQTQTEIILDAVKANHCFLNISYNAFPLPGNLSQAIYNITQGRTRCPRDPRCDIPQSCGEPPTPTPDPSLPNSTPASMTPLIIVAAVGGTTTLIAVTAAVILWRKWKSAQAGGADKPLLAQAE